MKDWNIDGEINARDYYDDLGGAMYFWPERDKCDILGSGKTERNVDRGVGNISISEADMEYLISKYPERFIEEGLTLLGRQISFGKNRLDLLFEDKKGVKLIVELQKGTLDRKHFYRMLDYYDDFKKQHPHDDVELIVIANQITTERKEKLINRDIEFKEIPMQVFISIAKSMDEFKNLPSTTKQETSSKENHEYNTQENIYDADLEDRITKLMDDRKYTKLGLAHFNKGNYEKAIAYFNKATELNLAYTEPYCFRGKSYLYLNDFNAALSDFNRSIKFGSMNYVNYCIRGDFYELINKYDLALNDYSKAIELNSEDDYPYWYRGKVHLRIGNYEQAIKDFSQVIALESLCEDEARLFRGLAYLRASIKCSDSLRNKRGEKKCFINNVLGAIKTIGGRHSSQKDYCDRAIADFNKVIINGLRSAEAYYFRSKAFAELGEFDRSEEDQRCYERETEYDPLYSSFDPLDEKGFFKTGIDYKSKENYELAIKAFEKAIQLKPGYCEAYSHRGDAYSKSFGIQDSHILALRDFDRAIAIDPNYADGYILRGKYHSDNDAHSEAIQDFNTAIKLNANCFDAYFYRGLAYYYNNDTELAINDLSASILIKPEYADAYYYRGSIHLSKNDYELAIADFNMASDLGTSQHLVLLLRGQAFINTGDLKRAINDITRYIDSNPIFVSWGYRDRGKAYLAIGDYSNAIGDFTRLIEDNPTNADAYGFRADVYLKQERYDLAIKDCGKALELKPTHSEANRWHTIIYQGDLNKIIADETNRIKNNNNDIEARWKRAIAYSYKGDYESEIEDYNVILNSDVQDNYAYRCRGLAYAKLEMHDLAIQDLSISLQYKLNDKDIGKYDKSELPDIMKERGNSYRALGKYDLAISDYSMAIELTPDEHRISDDYVTRGDLYHEVGEYQLAIRDYNTAIELFPSDLDIYSKLKTTYIGSDKIQDAISELLKYIEVLDVRINDDENDGDAYRQRGIAYTKLCIITGNKEEYSQNVHSDFKKASEKRPKDAEGLSLAATLYLIHDKNESSIRYFISAMRLGLKDAGLLCNLGVAYSNLQDYDKAILYYNMAINENPEHYKAFFNRAMAYYYKGEYEKAINNCNIAITKQENYAMAYLLLGKTYEALGDEENSKKSLALARIINAENKTE